MRTRHLHILVRRSGGTDIRTWMLFALFLCDFCDFCVLCGPSVLYGLPGFPVPHSPNPQPKPNAARQITKDRKRSPQIRAIGHVHPATGPLRRDPQSPPDAVTAEVGRAHTPTPVTNPHLVCTLILETKN